MQKNYLTSEDFGNGKICANENQGGEQHDQKTEEWTEKRNIVCFLLEFPVTSPFLLGWKDSPVVRNNDYYCRGTGFDSQNPHVSHNL